jgi:hypothetical protein
MRFRIKKEKPDDPWTDATQKAARTQKAVRERIRRLDACKGRQTALGKGFAENCRRFREGQAAQ